MTFDEGAVGSVSASLEDVVVADELASEITSIGRESVVASVGNVSGSVVVGDTVVGGLGLDDVEEAEVGGLGVLVVGLTGGVDVWPVGLGAVVVDVTPTLDVAAGVSDVAGFSTPQLVAVSNPRKGIVILMRTSRHGGALISRAVSGARDICNPYSFA